MNRKLIASIAILTLLFMSYQAGKRGISSAAEYFLTEYIDDWAVTGFSYTLEEWHNAKEFYDYALHYNPLSPDVLYKGAILYEWRASLLSNTLAQSRDFKQQSLALYRRSIRKRPTWPYVWSDFILAKVRANEIDAEFQDAFRITQELGSWEPFVQMGLIKAGLHEWTKLSLANKVILKQVIENALSVQFKIVTNFMRENNYLALMCYEMKGSTRLDVHCIERGI